MVPGPRTLSSRASPSRAPAVTIMRSGFTTRPRMCRKCVLISSRSCGVPVAAGSVPVTLAVVQASRQAARQVESMRVWVSGMPGMSGSRRAAGALGALGMVGAPGVVPSMRRSASCARFGLTRVPEPCADTVSPSAARSSYAATTVPRATPSCRASMRVLGRWSPAASTPVWMRVRIWVVIWVGSGFWGLPGVLVVRWRGMSATRSGRMVVIQPAKVV